MEAVCGISVGYGISPVHDNAVNDRHPETSISVVWDNAQ